MKTLNEQLKILDGQLAKREWLALGKLTLAEIALAPIVKRCLEFPIERPCPARAGEMAGRDRGTAGLPGGNRRQAQRHGVGRLRRRDAAALAQLRLPGGDRGMMPRTADA